MNLNDKVRHLICIHKFACYCHLYKVRHWSYYVDKYVNKNPFKKGCAGTMKKTYGKIMSMIVVFIVFKLKVVDPIFDPI